MFKVNYTDTRTLFWYLLLVTLNILLTLNMSYCWLWTSKFAGKFLIIVLVHIWDNPADKSQHSMVHLKLLIETINQCAKRRSGV